VTKHGGKRPGAGRPPAPAGTKRDHKVMVAFTKAEFDMLDMHSAVLGMSVTEFVRRKALQPGRMKKAEE
jgi:hypothetical protein